MQSILKELFYGNINPNAKSFVLNSECGKAVKTVSGEEKLNALFSGKELELSEKLMKTQSGSSYINEQEFFIEGFGLGARIASEIMDHNGGGIIDIVG